MLSAITRACGTDDARRRVASMPFSSGMLTSITTTSGRSCSARSTASRPLAASPTISMSASAARIILKPWRTTAWSSARRMRMRFMLDRDPHFNYNTLVEAGADRDIAPGAAGASAHPDHAQWARPTGLPDFRSGIAGEAAAVVVNGEANLIAARFQFDCDALRSGVARHVGERLLRDAEQVRLGLIGKAAGVAGFESRLNAGARGEALHQPAQTGLEAEIVEDGGAQKLRHLPHVTDSLFDQVQAVFQTRVVQLPADIERGEVGLDGGERLAQLVVQLVREAAGGGLLVFQHVPGDAAQLGGLPFHLAREPRPHANRNRRGEAGQKHAGSGEEERGGEQPGRQAIDLRLRHAHLAVLGLDEAGGHGGERSVMAE